MVRVKWWVQETTESGLWRVSGLMSTASAQRIVESGVYDRAHIVQDEEGFPPIAAAAKAVCAISRKAEREG